MPRQFGITRTLYAPKTYKFVFDYFLRQKLGFLCGAVVKNLPVNAGAAQDASLNTVFLPGEPHGQRSLAGYSP